MKLEPWQSASTLTARALVALCAVLAACGEKSPPQEPPTDVSVGRWRTAPREQALTPEQEAEAKRLESIGYLAGSTQAPSQSGTSRYDRERAFPGYNFYVSGHAAEALLVDMDGEVLHRWRMDYAQSFAQHPNDPPNPNEYFWRRAHLNADGSIIAIHDGLGILKLDRDSNLLWAHRNNAHHDLHVMPDGDIYTLTREVKHIPRVMEEHMVLEDFVVRLHPDGTTKAIQSLLETMERSEPEHDWRAAWERLWEIEKTRQLASPPTDLFHSNSITVLDGRFADRGDIYRKGNLLLSFCHLEMVLIVDPRQGRTLWSEVGTWALQHDPQLTADGGVIVFDNNWQKGRSRIVETDLSTGEVLWQYEGTETDPFWSRTCGAIQQLENGNLLISESDGGRAFEITRDGEIVWEFYNPSRAGDEGQYIATLFDMVRVDRAGVDAWLGQP